MTNIKKETNEILDQKSSFLEKILSSKLHDNKEQQVDLLLKNLSANIGQVDSSVILERIEKLSGDHRTHPHRKCGHTSHIKCNHQKLANAAEYLIKNSSEKEKGFSR